MSQTSQDKERHGCKDAEIVCFWNMETVKMRRASCDRALYDRTFLIVLRFIHVVKSGSFSVSPSFFVA